MINKIRLTADEVINLLKVAKENRTLDAWCDIAVQWIEGAQHHIDMAFHPELGWATDTEKYVQLYKANEVLEQKLEKISPVYSAVMEWTGSEASIDVLKHIIWTAKNDHN